MEQTEQHERPIEFHSRHDKSAYVGMIFFSFILIGVISLPFIPGEPTDNFTPLVIIGIVACFFILRLCFKAIQNMKTSYICGRTSLRQVRNQKEIELKWDEIIDLECTNAAGGVGELRVTLTDRDQKVMTIGTEYLPHGGRSLMALLQKRLEPIFEKKTREYLNGNQHWQFSAAKDVFKIENNQLHIEYPPRKKYLIPFQTLLRVEWLPGIISGTSPGHLIVEHQGGRIKLPQTIKGMQYFLFALKNIYHLNDIVNPVRSREDLDEMRRLSEVAGRKILCMILGPLLIIAMIIASGVAGWEMLKRHQTDTLGISTSAKIAAKEKDNNLLLKYNDADGKNHQQKVRVIDTFYTQAKAGDTIEILFHPAYKDSIAFDGKYTPSTYFMIGLIAICIFLIAVGIVLLIIGLWKFGNLRGTSKSLEEGFTVEKSPEISNQNLNLQQKEIASPLAPTPEKPDSNDLVTKDSPMAPSDTIPDQTQSQAAVDATLHPLEPDSNKCSQCNTMFSGDYYLSSGLTWCPVCRGNSEKIKPKIGCFILLRSIFAGFCGAIVGGGLWATMVITTGYELGIIAIFVGLLTGYAVKLGSGACRSRLLQIMAVLFTFLGLSYSTIPILVSEFRKDPTLLNKFKQDIELARQKTGKDNISYTDIETIEREIAKDEVIHDTVSTVDTSIKQDEIASETSDTPLVQPKDSTKKPADIQQKHPPQPSQILKSTQSQDKKKSPVVVLPRYDKPPEDTDLLIKAGKFLLFIVLGFLIILFGPIVVYIICLFNSPLSLLFTAIAFWEAWRLNKIEVLEFQGPFNNDEQINFDKAEFTADSE